MSCRLKIKFIEKDFLKNQNSLIHFKAKNSLTSSFDVSQKYLVMV